jgi:hypothetical protein
MPSGVKVIAVSLTLFLLCDTVNAAIFGAALQCYFAARSHAVPAHAPQTNANGCALL